MNLTALCVGEKKKWERKLFVAANVVKHDQVTSIRLFIVLVLLAIIPKYIKLLRRINSKGHTASVRADKW